MTQFPKREKDLFGPRSPQMTLGDIDESQSLPTPTEEADKRPTALTSQVLEESLALASGVEAEFEDQNLTSDSDIQPFDPSQIKIDTRPMSLDMILKRMKHNEINLTPDFQRMGGIWDDLKMSRLIESLLIRIPLPAFYMDATDESKWLVIDGLQRLTTLKRFIMPDNDKDRLKLKNMEFWKEYNGFTFEQLPRQLQRRIEETQVTVYLVEKGTPHNVKFNIFKRINTGGVPLSGQEIRHALNLGYATDVLERLAKSSPFLIATDNGVSPMRMTDRECVLRFLAFTLKDYTQYTARDELDSFLNDTMKTINAMSPTELEPLTQAFNRAMKRAHELFDNRAFRKPIKGNRRSTVSKALFEVWSVNLEALDEAEFDLLKTRHESLEERFSKLMKDQEFDVAISYSTGDWRRVHYRFAKINEIIRETLDHA